jgi:hypothetical protein
MKQEKGNDAQRERSERNNAFGLTILVNHLSGQVSIKVEAGPVQGNRFTFRNLDEVETIFNKSIDRLDPLDLLRITNYKYSY